MRSRGEEGSDPVGGEPAQVVAGLARRFRLSALEARHDHRAVVGAFALVNGVIAVGIMSAAALVTGEPWVFPSLGPTAFLLFSAPTRAASSPRNAIVGHAIGAAVGYLMLVAFGLTDAAPALATDVTWERVLAAALSLGLTSGFMIWLGVPHAPAGATTLIVSLGILHTLPDLSVLMLAVVGLVAQALVINRLAGVDYPWWAPRPPPRVADR